MEANRREELLAVLESAQADIEGLLEQAGEARLSEPGVTGEWSVKDLLAHLAWWEGRVVAWAEALSQARQPTPLPWPKDWSEDQENAAIFESNRERTLADVLEGWRQVHRDIIAWVRAMSEEDLFHREIEWLGGAPFADAIAGNSYEHQQIHAAEIRAWLNLKG